MDDRPIGIIDSGIGGITVLNTIVQRLPNENIIYLGDTKRIPYGTKTKEEIIEFAKQGIEFLISQDVKLIVVACETISGVLKRIVNNYEIPIIGTIRPVAKNLNRYTKTNEIGIITTPISLQNNVWKKEIAKYYKGVNILNETCPLLVGLAEEGVFNTKEIEPVIDEYMKPFYNSNIDCLILGCTHYSLFKKYIEKCLGDNVNVVDVGEEVSKKVERMLENGSFRNMSTNGTTYKCFITKDVDKFVNVTNMFSDIKFDSMESVSLESLR